MRWKRAKREEDRIVLNVKKSSDKKAYKDDIISGLYRNGIIMKKINGIFERHKIPLNAGFEDDLNQIVFEELCKKSADEIIEMYEDNPSRLIGLCVKIAVLKGVARTKNYDNPNQNFVDSVLFLSRIKYVNNQYSEDAMFEYIVDEDTEEKEDDIFDLFDEKESSLSTESKAALAEFRKVHFNDAKWKQNRTFSSYFSKKATNKISAGNLLMELNQILKQMDKEILLQEIEKVMPQIKEYHTTRRVSHLTTEDVIEIKRIWDSYINPSGRLMTSCTTCIKDAMDIMESFYSKHKPASIQELPKKIVEPIVDDAQKAIVDDAQKPNEVVQISKVETVTPRKAKTVKTSRAKQKTSNKK